MCVFLCRRVLLHFTSLFWDGDPSLIGRNEFADQFAETLREKATDGSLEAEEFLDQCEGIKQKNNNN